VLTRTAGEPVTAITPAFEVFEDGTVEVRPAKETISSGLLGVLRIDAEGRGFAGGLGLAISRGKFEGDIMVLRSNVTGGYLGFRYRFFTASYVRRGHPGLERQRGHRPDNMKTTETKLAIGARAKRIEPTSTDTPACRVTSGRVLLLPEHEVRRETFPTLGDLTDVMMRRS
jgi:hypothetical protein